MMKSPPSKAALAEFQLLHHGRAIASVKPLLSLVFEEVVAWLGRTTEARTRRSRGIFVTLLESHPSGTKVAH